MFVTLVPLLTELQPVGQGLRAKTHIHIVS